MVGLGSMVFLILCILPAAIRAQGTEARDDKTRCMEQFVRWCDSMDYKGSFGTSVLSYMYHDSNRYNRVFCFTDSEGTNCTRNGSPWIECTPDHSLTYGGQPLTSDTSPTDVGDDICESSEKAFGDLGLQNSRSFDNETLKEFKQNMDSFFQEMAALQQQMRRLAAELANGSFLGRDFMGGFDQWMFSPRDDASPDESTSDDKSSDGSKRSGSDDSNQIEKE